jgi:large subunit ribosomal protein L33
MAGKKKDIRIVVKLKSTESDHVYYTEKNRRNDLARLELRKYDPILKKHVLYKETK